MPITGGKYKSVAEKLIGSSQSGGKKILLVGTAQKQSGKFEFVHGELARKALYNLKPMAFSPDRMEAIKDVKH